MAEGQDPIIAFLNDRVPKGSTISVSDNAVTISTPSIIADCSGITFESNYDLPEFERLLNGRSINFKVPLIAEGVTFTGIKFLNFYANGPT